jgi:hypothetical protein
MVARSLRIPPKDAYAAFVVPWEVDEELYGVSYRRPGGIYEDYSVGSREDTAAVARDINARASRRGLAVVGGQ